MKEIKIKPSSAKAKGRTFQQWCRDQILTAFSEHLQVDDVRSTSMGAGGEDVQLSPKARQYFPYQIEAKSRDRIAVYGWYEQAASHGSIEPLLVIKQNRSRPLVVVDAEHFFSLVQKLYG